MEGARLRKIISSVVIYSAAFGCKVPLQSTGQFRSGSQESSVPIPTNVTRNRDLTTNSDCRTPQSDIFSARARDSENQGCIQIDTQPVTVLTGQESKERGIIVEPGAVAVANVRDKDYSIAVIPLSKAKQISYVLQDVFLAIPVNMGHAMIQVEFSADVLFYNQKEPENKVSGNIAKQPIGSARKLYFSFEVSTLFNKNSKDPSYLASYLRKLADGRFPIVGGIYSHDGFVKARGSPSLRPFLLSLGSQSAAKYVSYFISRAHSNGVRVPYLLDSRNCVTEMFSVFDSFLKHPNPIKRVSKTRTDGDWMPTLAVDGFRARGMIKNQ